VEVAAIARRISCKKGQMIFNQGDPGTGLYIVQKGQIKIFKLSADGKEQILHIYGPGNIFGEVPVFQGKNFPAAAMALELSRILFIPRDRFIRLITHTPTLGMNMLADLSRRLREFADQVEALSLKEVPERLAGYIRTLARAQKKEDWITLPISKTQIANLIGTTPETLSRILKKMTDDHLIETKGKHIRILDPDRLADLSHSGPMI
jgi:CRP/FNR family transcriptional regulator, dissimilatory nitrate respiration regulator